MDIVEKIQERKKIIEERKKYVIEILSKRMNVERDRYYSKLAEILDTNGSRKSKFFKLNRLMSEVRTSANDISACKNGCSKCCYQRVEISQTEADMIAYNISKSAVKLAPDYKIRPIDDYNKNTPCTFLIDDSCSIYEHRPFMCRNHVNLDIDNLLCNFENWEMATVQNPNFVEVPMLSAEQYLRAYHELSGADIYGDIRDFFPK